MPPLDRMRKIRRTILKTINDVRAAHNCEPLQTDFHGNKAANEYALYLLSNPEDEAKCLEICKESQVHFIGSAKPLVGFARLEEEEQQGTLHEQMMDAHGLLLELEPELAILSDPLNTHIGIGFAFTKEQVKVVEIVTRKAVVISTLEQAPDGSVVCIGRTVDKEAGIYAARIVALSKLQKDLVVAGPPQIECNRDSGDFKITMPGPIEGAFYNQEDPRVFELYISRLQIAKIAYGEPSNDRVKVSQLEIAHSMPMEQLPDPRTVLEDAADFEKEERDRAMKQRKEAELEAIRMAEKEARDAELAKKKQAMLEAKQDESDEEIEEDASQGMDKRSRSRTHNES